MYLRTIQRRNKDGSVVRYVQLAHNVRHPESGNAVARVLHSFGREDQLDRAALARLIASVNRYLGPDAELAGDAPREDGDGQPLTLAIHAGGARGSGCDEMNPLTCEDAACREHIPRTGGSSCG